MTEHPWSLTWGSGPAAFLHIAQCEMCRQDPLVDWEVITARITRNTNERVEALTSLVSAGIGLLA